MSPASWTPISQTVTARATRIPGLYVFELDVRGDNRGWFKENYNRQKALQALQALGPEHAATLEAFQPVQNNVSFNRQRGVARGIHAEPWSKYISLATGGAFAAIVDLRKGATFGMVETLQLTPNNALFVPNGCGNSFQALTDDVTYTYLVDAHWSPDAAYTFVNLRDPDLNIPWPIPLTDDVLSDKDINHPPLQDITPLEV